MSSILITTLDRNLKLGFKLVYWLGLFILARFFKFASLRGHGDRVVDYRVVALFGCGLEIVLRDKLRLPSCKV